MGIFSPPFLIYRRNIMGGFRHKDGCKCSFCGLSSWNKGLTKETDERVRKNEESSNEVRNERLASGEISVWNKDLTMEDERVKRNIEKRNETMRDKYWGKKFGTYEKQFGEEKAKEIKRKQSRGMMGKNTSEKFCKMRSRVQEEVWKDKDYRKHQSEIHSKVISEKILNGWSPVSMGKSGYFYSNKNGKWLHYMSLYELTAYQILECMSKVIEYKVNSVCIKYLWNGGIHRYHIDLFVFYDDGSKELIEIKPLYKLSDDKVRSKIEAGKKYEEQSGILFSIWTEKELYRKEMF